jgi:ABC-type Fe3+/spermidine/putrescine transport system ATPase subunit
VLQTAPPADVYDRPANAFVAGFVGRANLIEGRVVDSQTVDTPLGRLTTPVHDQPRGAVARLLVRPERLIIATEGGENTFAATVLRDRFFGAGRRVEVAAGGGRLELDTASRGPVTAVHVPRDAIQFLGEDPNRRA